MQNEREQGSTGKRRMTVILGPEEHRDLAAIKYNRSLEEGRDVSGSRIMRDLLHEAARSLPGPRRVA